MLLVLPIFLWLLRVCSTDGWSEDVLIAQERPVVKEKKENSKCRDNNIKIK